MNGRLRAYALPLECTFRTNGSPSAPAMRCASATGCFSSPPPETGPGNRSSVPACW
ncbi:hypothetical protein LNO81_31270 [Klebsiella variicola subsp. variicola]|nr:hypothetical protein [Klebsiella variicola subsp. variicola]